MSKVSAVDMPFRFPLVRKTAMFLRSWPSPAALSRKLRERVPVVWYPNGQTRDDAVELGHVHAIEIVDGDLWVHNKLRRGEILNELRDLLDTERRPLPSGEWRPHACECCTATVLSLYEVAFVSYTNIRAGMPDTIARPLQGIGDKLASAFGGKPVDGG